MEKRLWAAHRSRLWRGWCGRSSCYRARVYAFPICAVLEEADRATCRRSWVVSRGVRSRPWD